MEAIPAVTAAYEAALPDDPRVEKKKMFGLPCAFVARQMFFGTFDSLIIARVGPDRAAALVGQPGFRAFEPTEGRPWKDYVAVEGTAEGGLLRSLAAEALAWTMTLPPKSKKPAARS